MKNALFATLTAAAFMALGAAFAALDGQTTVTAPNGVQVPCPSTVSVTITTELGSYTANATPQTIQAYCQFIGDTAARGADGTATFKYPGGVPELLVRHVVESLNVPLLKRYPDPATAALAADAQAAQTQAESAFVQAAGGQ